MLFTSALVSMLTSIEMDIRIYKRTFDMIMVSGADIVPLVVAEFVGNSEEKLETLKNPEDLYMYLRDNIYGDVYSVIGEEGLTRMFKNI